MNMLIGANMSGRAINITKTNVCHAISYPLTEIYGIPHGIACGMSLVYFANKMGFKIKSIKKLIPRYKIDRKRIAKEAINNPKLMDYPLPITELDIVKSLA
jgi:alcohol dehydrogenase class IV